MTGGYLVPPPDDPAAAAAWWRGVAARLEAGHGVLMGEDYETDGPPAPPGETLRYLSRADVGRLFGVSGDAVRKWQQRYASGEKYRPFPAPDLEVAGRPLWSPRREPELWAWYRDKPGRGAGGGRPRKTAAQPE